MPVKFERTLRSLEADRFRGTAVWLLLGTAVLAGWMWWMTSARIPLFESSGAARIEVETAAYSIESPVAGTLVEQSVELGSVVQAGDRMFQLDCRPQRDALSVEESLQRGTTQEIAVLDQQIVAEQQTLASLEQVSQSAVGEAEATASAAETMAALRRREADNLIKLSEQDLERKTDVDRAEARAREQELQVVAARSAVDRIAADYRTQTLRIAARVESLKRERQRLESSRQTTQARIRQLESEIETRQIRAAIAGRIGSLGDLRVGSYVDEGERVAVVVPEGGYRAIAEFPPQAAVGRIRPGQPARVRLHGFPWGQHGTVRATVDRVAGEPQRGHIRIELQVDAGVSTTIPLQHGLPGSVEVEVERVTPMQLVLRTVGKWIQPTAAASVRGISSAHP